MGTTPSPREGDEPPGLVGAAGHGPALLREHSRSGWRRVHTSQPAKRNYSCFILPWTFLVPAVRVYKSSSCQLPLRGRGQLHCNIKGLQVSGIKVPWPQSSCSH